MRKYPDPARAESLNATIRARLDLWKLGNFLTLVAAYKRNIVFLQAMDKPSTPKNSRDMCYQKTVDLIWIDQLKRVRHRILSNGCSDPMAHQFLCRWRQSFPVGSSHPFRQ